MAKKSAPFSPSPVTASSMPPAPAEQRTVGDCDHGSSLPTPNPELEKALRRLRALNTQTVCSCMAPSLALAGFRNPLNGKVTTDLWASHARRLLIESDSPTHLSRVLWEPLSIGMASRDASVGAAALLSVVALRSFYAAHCEANGFA